ncbi:MAG TPA: IPT/TIG domain-containing protein [Candidatus Acidoferrum sp.]|nr:IPT/TIG domain-containing protein [Candidatus Acidoferrum sp.]
MRDFRGAGRDSKGRLFVFGLALASFCTALLISGCAGLIQSASPGNNGGGSLSISNVTTSNATPASIVVNWQTSSPATSQVEYGPTTNYGSLTAVDTAMVTNHQVSVANLKPGTTYHCRVHSTDASNQTAISGDFSCTTPADTTPPAVSITSPAANSTVSGTINVTANASDNVAVANVQFKVDGANTGSPILSAPYTYALNTKTLSDGSHVLTAVATDTSGNSATSSGVSVTVSNAIPGPTISSLSPVTGVVGTSVTIAGANFGATQGTSTVKFNGTTATPTSWSATSIMAAVPAGATTGNVVVTVGGMASNGVSFTVTTAAPSIASLSPVTGIVGAAVTITGTNFGATQGSSTLKFNGTAATPTSWSATSIVAAVPAGATTGNVVVTVGGVASNGVSFTVTTPAPTILSLSPTSGAVGASVTITGANFGATQGSSTVTFNGTAATPTGWSATSIVAPVPSGATTGNVVVTVGVVASNGVSFTVSTGSGTGATGPLRALAGNPYYFTDGSGKAILLTGSQTWDDFQDLGNAGTPPVFDFNAYVTFLKSHGQNATILWRKDLPTYCGWGAGGTWQVAQFPWLRTGGSTGTQVASDGLPAFDLTQFDPAYFSRLRARVIQLQQNGIYAIVELFDGLGLTNNRCSNDGYPFTGGNNVNGVDDGGGTNSMTMTSTNAITGFQDAFVQHVIDTLNDQPNVLWEISEEAPDNSTWWQGHMISLIHTYEAGKPFQHPVGFPSLNVSGASDSTLYNSNADWVAPMATVSPTSSCGSGTPACKVNINDSDHSFYYPNFLDSSGNVQNQTVRNYVWENFANGSQVLFMDPYEIYWTAGSRNLCPSPLGGICSGPDTKYDNFRDNLGYTLNYANRMDLAKMTPHSGLTNTGFCLAQTPATGAEYLVYAPNGGNITLNLSNTTRLMNVEWFNPATGTASSGGTVTGGSTLTFTPPFSSDAVLYVVDAAGHN